MGFYIVLLLRAVKVEGDLFVDCSGFKRILVDKLEKNNFVSYENEKMLLILIILTFHLENKSDTIINNYTKVTCKNMVGCGIFTT